MEQAIRKQDSKQMEETRKAFVEFLRRINQKKITILSFEPDQIVFRDEENKIRKIYKIGDRFIESQELSDKIERPIFHDQKPQIKKKPKGKKRNIKTKKGRIASPNAIKIIAPAIISIGVLASSMTLKHEEPVEMVTIVSEPIEEENEIMEEKINVAAQEVQGIQNEIPLVKSEMVISQSTSVEVIPKENMVKREETDYSLGNTIDFYTNRYGIPNAIGKALLTQERPDSGYENVGQLTRKVCGEKIMVPIINHNENEVNKIGVEKIYIVRDEPQRSSFEEEQSYKTEMERYKSQLAESKDLVKEGYQIYYYQNAVEDVEQNIHLSMAYLAHCVYKCDMNVNQGIRGYNCGYTLSRSASDSQIANGEISVGDANYNQNVFSYLYPSELGEMVWHLKSVPKLSESEKKTMTTEEIQQKEYELSEEATIISIMIDFTQVRNLDHEKENGHTL